MSPKDDYNYGVVLDAGSSGTRSYVYKWLKSDIARQKDVAHVKALPLLETKKKWTKKIKPGVSSFGNRPERVGPDHLKDLLVHAASYIPTEQVPQTPIFLLATAGMRLLTEKQRNAVLDNICSYVKTESRFLIGDCKSNIQVISGETEGLYGWIAANYLLGGFDAPGKNYHGKGHHTYGFLDMGGASAQIAFAPNATEAEKHAEDLKLVRLRTTDGATQEHRVFVTTWLGFGVNEARRRYLKALLEAPGSASNQLLDPCLPTGYTTKVDPQEVLPKIGTTSERNLVGTGLFNECLKRTYPLLEKDAPCLDEPCLINGQHVPAIDFDVNHFIGISEYWHTTHEALQLATEDEKVFDFKTYQTRVKQFCERPWSETQAEIKKHTYKHLDEQTAYELCFKSSWLINMLHDGIGIPRVGLETTPSKHTNTTKEIAEVSKQKGYLDPFQAVDKIKSTEVSWTMGKMALYASSQISPISSEPKDSYPVGFGSNVPGQPIPIDFEYPGGTFDQHSSSSPHTNSSSSTSPSLTDKFTVPFLKSDSLHRIPGLLLFLFIIIIALFYLCGRGRRLRSFTRYLPIPTSSSPSSSSPSSPTPAFTASFKKPTYLNRSRNYPSFLPRRITSFISQYVPTSVSNILHRRTSSLDHDRALEEGDTEMSFSSTNATTRLYDPSTTILNPTTTSSSAFTHADFELGDYHNANTNPNNNNNNNNSIYDSDTDSIVLRSSAAATGTTVIGGSGSGSGYSSPSTHRSRTPRPGRIAGVNRTSSSNALWNQASGGGSTGAGGRLRPPDGTLLSHHAVPSLTTSTSVTGIAGMVANGRKSRNGSLSPTRRKS